MTIRYKRTVLATCCIPWKHAENETIDEDLFNSSIQYLVEHGISDLYIFGTAGEGHNVSDRAFRHITDLFIAEMHRLGATPMVGVIGTSLSTLLERIEYAASRGCGVFQFAYAGWGSLNDRELFDLFRTVCGRFPALQFIHYNIARSGRVVMPEEYSRLAEENPNLVGTKYGAGNPEIVAGLVTRASSLRHFLTELGFYYGSVLGECSLLASISSTSPPTAREYFQAAVDGDLPKLSLLYSELARMMVALRVAVGPGPHIDAAYDKVLSKVNDSRFPLDLLPPYEGAAQVAYRAYREELAANFPRWLNQTKGRTEQTPRSMRRSQANTAPFEAESTDLS